MRNDWSLLKKLIWLRGSAAGGGGSAYTLTDTIPYIFRKTGGSLDVGNGKKVIKLIGGSVVVNQLIQNGNFADGTTEWVIQNGTASVSNNVCTITPTDATTNVVILQANKNLLSHVYLGLVSLIASSRYILQLRDASAVRDIAISTASTSWQTTSGIYKIASDKASPTGYIRLLQYDTEDTGNVQIKDFQVIDLTLMFGSTIADYIYSLETATAGAGVSWLKDHGYFNSYVPYNAGELVSVQSGDSVTRGFNQWDEEWELGRYQYADGNPVASTTQIRCKNFIPLKPNTTYYCYEGNTTSSSYAYILYYGANYEYLGYDGDASHYAISNQTFTTPEGCYYARFYCNAEYGTTYNNDICINLSKTTGPPKNGDYVPYTSHTYPIDTVTLRGIPKLDASNNLYYDGDEYLPSGTVNRRYGIVDLGTLDWTYQSASTRFYSTGISALVKAPTSSDDTINVICSKYEYMSLNALGIHSVGCSISSTRNIYVKDTAYTDATTFKTAMDGVYLIYELATATTESATAYDSKQIVIAGGTEEFVGSQIPVGHETAYKENQ